MDILKRNNVRVVGRSGQPMLFAHGFGCDQNMWRFIAPAFEEDYRIVLFDYVGAGKSDLMAYDAERYSTLDGYSEDVLDVCRALDLNNIIFVGHSVSGVVGILAAIRKPELFDRLIFVSPSPSYINDLPAYRGGLDRADVEALLQMMEKNYMGWANYLAPAVMGNQAGLGLTAELEQSFCSTDPVIARRFAQATFLSDNREDLPTVSVPSFILQCSEDAIAPVEVGQFMHRSMPESTLTILEAHGHCPHMSHPDLTIRAIKDYLAGNAGSHAT